MKKLILIFTLLAVLGTPFSGKAAETASNKVTLESALRIAFVKNPDMQIARQEISAAKGRRLQAEALPDPEVGFEIGGLKKNDSGDRNTKLDSFSVEQPLDPLGTRFFNARAAANRVSESKASFQMVWNRISTDVRAQYAEILFAQKELDSARQNLERSRQFMGRIEDRFQSGRVNKAEWLRASVESKKAENDVLAAESKLAISTATMNALLGQDIEEAFIPSIELNEQVLLEEKKRLMTLSQENKAELKAAKSELKATSYEAWAEKFRIIFPKTSIGVERTTEDYENDTAILLKASYPLWGFNLGKAQESSALKKAQMIRSETVIRSVDLQRKKAVLEVEQAEKQVEVLHKTVEEAREMIRFASVQYQEGDFSFLSYLETLKTTRESELGYLRALQNWQNKNAQLEIALKDAAVPDEVKS